MGHADILDEKERLSAPLVGSVILHAAILGVLAFYAFIVPSAQQFGEPNPHGGGAFSITPVAKINLPRPLARPNPVANETESQVPQQPVKQETQKRAPEPDAIALKSREALKRQSNIAASKERYRPPRPDRPNQIYSKDGPALSTPIFGATGTGGVGVGPGSVLGTRFGWYEQLIRQRIAEKWRTGDVDLRSQAAPAIVTFDILRDGSTRNIRVMQSSGNYTLDSSAQRAVTEASPLPVLPPGFERDSAQVEFWFQLKR